MDGGEDSGHEGRRWVVVAVALLAAMLVASGIGYAVARWPTPRKPIPARTNLAKQQVLRASAISEFGSHEIGPLDPGGFLDTTTQPIVNLLFDGLVTVSPEGGVELWGADHVAVSPDGLTYMFHLRSGQLYSDGAPVRAVDFAGTITRALNPCLAAPGKYNLFAIEGAADYAAATNCADPTGVSGRVRKPLPSGALVADESAGTLRIRLAKPSGAFLPALASSGAGAIEPSVLGGNYEVASEQWTANLAASAAHPTGQGGSGMYYVAHEDQQGHLVLKRNPYWWGRGNYGITPILTEIDFTVFPDADAAYRAYDQGGSQGNDLDFMDGVLISEVAKSKPPDLHIIPALVVESIGFNWRVAPFTNADARRAFCLAINRETLARTLANFPDAEHYPVYGAPLPSWHLVPEGMPGYDPNVTGVDGVTAVTGNLSLARAHWAAYKATLHGAPVPAIAYFYDQFSDQDEALGKQLVAQWNAAFGGDLVGMRLVDPSVRVGYGYFQKTVQAHSWGWFADYLDPLDFLVSPYTPVNRDGVSVPEASALVARAEAAPDAATRLSLYDQAEQALIQQVAACPLFQDQHAYRVRSWVHNLVENGLGMVPLDTWAKVYIVGN